MVELFKEFTFEAAHRVPNYSDVHGHSFQVEIYVRGDADPVYGWASSLTEVDPQIDAVQHSLDHRFLNDIEGLDVPSLENIACWIYNRLDNHVPGLDRVVVRRGMAGHGEGCVYRGRVAA
ncbi:MAG: 6-carboxytetrahydropterin synthase [Alphaproteobacteria bacterium]|nr:6-carboxytetrahydropterin synthase [Alphaproteobacteria bacterium]